MLSRRWMGCAAAAALLAALAAGAPSVAGAQEAERTFISEHFSITWNPEEPGAPTSSDLDGDGVPDAIERLAEAFDEARAFEVEHLGYLPPPGEGLYPVYVSGATDRGYTRPAPGGEGRSRASYIVVPSWLVNDSTPANGFRVFAAHEFFHAVQFGYDSGEPDWIREASSEWVQGLFTSAESNAGSVRYFLPFPRLSLDQNDGTHEYGAFLFLQFLSERYGGTSIDGAGLIKEWWEAMAAPEAIPSSPDLDVIGALRGVLGSRGVSLAAAWADFLVWQWDIGRFEHGDLYRAIVQGATWRRPLRSTWVRSESCRLVTDTPDGSLLPSLSGDYALLLPARKGPRHALASVVVEGPPGTVGSAIIKAREGTVEARTLGFDDAGVASFELPFGRSDVERLVLAVGNGGATAAPITIGYSMRLGGGDRTAMTPPSGPSSVSHGVAARLTGSVTCGGRAAAEADIEITETEVVSGARRTFTTPTDLSGRWSLLVTPEANVTYGAAVLDPLYSPAVSAVIPVGVRVSVTLDVDPDEVLPGQSVAVSGVIAPVHPDAAAVVEYRRPEGEWINGVVAAIRPDGSYEGEIVLPGTGVWELRTRVSSTGDADHLPGTSVVRLVRVVGG